MGGEYFGYFIKFVVGMAVYFIGAPLLAALLIFVQLRTLNIAVEQAATSVQNAFSYVVDLTGLLFALFYILTALAGIAYYRRRIAGNVWDAITVGILPLPLPHSSPGW